MIYFDLDGVIRDLCKAYFGFQPNIWDCGLKEKILLDPSPLLKAPPTEYYPVIKEIFKDRKIYIITFQLSEEAKKYTFSWIKNHFRNSKVIFVNSPEEKISILKKGDILIEDFPLFHQKDFIGKTLVLIDKPYNQSSFCHIRIFSPVGLKYFLFSFENFKRVFSLSKKVPSHIEI